MFSTIVLLALAAFSLALAAQTILGDYALAGTMLSAETWTSVSSSLGGRLSPTGGGRTVDGLSLGMLFLCSAAAAALLWLGGAALLARRTATSFASNMPALAGGFGWWLIPGAWVLVWTLAHLTGWETLQTALASTPQLWCALALAGFAATFFALGSRDDDAPAAGGRRGVPRVVWLAMAVYVVVFTAMNWQLYRGLHLPHGDSAMYEEHLWNLTHGKGFRSYLDPGLFLGEHIQVIHVALVPLHILWPSQMLLELCESLALAAGAVPVFLIARRHTGSDKAAALLACAYLLYFPAAVPRRRHRPEDLPADRLRRAAAAVGHRPHGTGKVPQHGRPAAARLERQGRLQHGDRPAGAVAAAPRRRGFGGLA
jgi:hypothetical protein